MRFLFVIIFSSAFTVPAYAQPAYVAMQPEPVKFIPIEKIILYKLGERIIPIRIFQYGDLKDIICINLHDNENTSVLAAKSVLELKGGTLIKIENNRQRIVHFKFRGISYGFDPNRIFSKKGIEQTLKENKRVSPQAIAEVEKFAQRLLQLIPDNTSCIIALHNNTNEAYSVATYLAGNPRESDAKAVYADSLQDIDDIAFTTDSLLYRKMADNGYNSIWQDNVNARKDGSLSVYYGEKNKRYINIETQHGKIEQYEEMLSKLMAILVEENKITTIVLPDIQQYSKNLQKPVDN